MSVLLIIVSGLLNAVHDALYHQKILSKSKWWNPQLSWVNKYKDGDITKGEKFFGSSTFLVWLTDGIHLIKLAMYSLLITGCVLSETNAIILIVLFLSAFQGFYWILEKISNKQ